MTVRLAAGAIGAWLLLLVIMFANGVVRVGILEPRLGEAPARQAASLLGVALVVAFSSVYVRRGAPARSRELVAVGLLWLALTLAFEFGFGRASGRSWSELLADYDLLHGRLWPLVLAATLVGPWACGAWFSKRTR